MITEEFAFEVMLSHGLQPLGPLPRNSEYSPSKANWPCICIAAGHFVQPRYNSIQQNTRSSGCRLCGEQRRGIAKRIPEDIACAEMIAAGAIPVGDYQGSIKTWECTCTTCGHTIYPSHRNVRNGCHPCVYCIGHKVDIDIAIAAMEAAGATPLEPFPGSDDPWPCRCHKCGNVKTPRYSSIKAGQGPCGDCSVNGFKIDQPAIVYVIANTSLNALKVGVANSPRRLREHGFRGWSPLEVDGTPLVLEAPSGRIALEVEKEVLRWLRGTLGLGPCLTRSQVPQGGHTETAALNAVPLEHLATLIQASLEAWLHQKALLALTSHREN
jgi:hypothetical protein